MNYLRCTRRNRYQYVNGRRFVDQNYSRDHIELNALGQPPLTEEQHMVIRANAEQQRATRQLRAEQAAAEKQRMEQQLADERAEIIRAEARKIVADELAVIRAEFTSQKKATQADKSCMTDLHERDDDFEFIATIPNAIPALSIQYADNKMIGNLLDYMLILFYLDNK